MQTEQAKKVSDLRLRILQAFKEGKEIREVVSREEIREALQIIRENRRLVSSAAKTSDTKAKSAPLTEAESKAVLDQLGL